MTTPNQTPTQQVEALFKEQKHSVSCNWPEGCFCGAALNNEQREYALQLATELERLQKELDDIITLCQSQPYELINKVRELRSTNAELTKQVELLNASETCTTCHKQWNPSLIESGMCIFCIATTLKRENGELKSALSVHGQARIAVLCNAVKANHKWHLDYDEHDGYPESDLCQLNLKALSQSNPAAEEIVKKANNFDGLYRLAKLYWHDGECYCLSKTEGGNSEPCFHCQMSVLLKSCGWTGEHPDRTAIDQASKQEKV